MVFLKGNDIMVFVIFLLSLKGFYSPSGDYENLDLTLSLPGESSSSYQGSASQTFRMYEEETPELVKHIINDRQQCLNDIYFVFAKNASPRAHIMYAFRKLTLIYHRLSDNVRNYYSTFHFYVYPGGLNPFMEYYNRFPERFRGDEQINAPDSLKQLFNVTNLGEVIYNALYYMDEKIVRGTMNECFIGYFELIISKLLINLAPPRMPAFQEPLEFCKSSFPMPPMYEKWDVDTDLRL